MRDALLDFDLKLSLFDLVGCILWFQKLFFMVTFANVFSQWNLKLDFEQEEQGSMKEKAVEHSTHQFQYLNLCFIFPIDCRFT